MGKYVLIAFAFLLLSINAFSADERVKKICDVSDENIFSLYFGTPKTAAMRFRKREGDFPDYALVKSGAIASCYIHLITVHGYVDNKRVCEFLANRQNKEESVISGLYFCIALN